jgi:hypothetical protein
MLRRQVFSLAKFVGGAGAAGVPPKKTASAATSSASSTPSGSASSSSSSFDPDRLRAYHATEQEQQREREKLAMLKKQEDDKVRAARQLVEEEERAKQEKEDAARKYRESQKEAAEKSVENIITRFNSWRKEMTMKRALLEYGAPFSIWYFLFTSFYTAVLALIVHFRLVSFIPDSGDLAEMCGETVKEKFNHIGGMTKTIGPVTLSGRAVATYVVLNTLLAPFIPFKVALAMGTFPIMMRAMPAGVRNKARQAATQQATTTAAAKTSSRMAK